MKYILSLIAFVFISINNGHAEIVDFILQSNDTNEISGDHGGRPYHVFNEGDEAVYITVSDWQGGHDPDDHNAWPISDGFINWPTIDDPNGTTGRPEVYNVDSKGQIQYVYYNKTSGGYELYSSPDLSTESLVKQVYQEWENNGALNFGNNGLPSGGIADRQNAIVTEFDLNRPYLEGLNSENLISAYLEITIDRVVDMTLSGHNTSVIPSKMYVNAFAGDGIVGIYENAQADFDRIDHENADAEVWLTLDGKESGMSVTDFALSWYKLVDPGEGLPFTFQIDITDSLLDRLKDNVDFAGYTLSGSPDGDFTLASFDLVNNSTGDNYLPKLIITANVEPLVSDFDGNYRVDMFDFARLSALWLSEDKDDSFERLFDISDPADRVIDLNDLAVFSVQWLDDRNRD